MVKEAALIMGLAFASFWPGHSVWKENKILCDFPRKHTMMIQEKVCLKLGGKVLKPVVTPEVKIDRVVIHNCTKGSSCYGWLTGVEVKGKDFSTDSRIKLLEGLNEYTGSYQGGNGKTYILTDFYNLPRCKFFDVEVAGSSGVASEKKAVASVCP
jgi:hypothetical protein